MLITHEDQLKQVAANLAEFCRPPLVIYLHGELGAGKTTFTRGFLRGIGYDGKVKSPTYTLVECYQLPHFQICHFDLYRIQDPEELELIGIRDYFHDQSICLIEWPELGEGGIPPADINCHLAFDPRGRQLNFSAGSPHGREILSNLNAKAEK